MDSQDTDMVDEVDEAKLAPLGDGEPETEDPSESSPDANVNSREVLEIHQHQAMGPDLGASQDPASSHDPSLSQDPAESQDTAASQDPVASPHPAPNEDPGPHENQNGDPDNMEGNSPLLGLPFPRKLWMIVEDDAFTSVSWNDAGDTVIIKEDLFQSEVLCRRGADQIFETDSLKSFICLLNLHGFSKIRPRDPSVYHSVNDRIMIYRNANFQRDKPQLIDNVKRKGHLMITAWPGNSTPPKKKKQAADATRRSLRFQLKQRSNEGGTRAQKTDPNVQGPSGTRSFMLPTFWSIGGMARRATQETCHAHHSEPTGPSGEGTSRNVRFAPTATATRDCAGEEPTSLPNYPDYPDYPDYDSVMSLYNTCYTILLAAASAMDPHNEPEREEEKEEEGSSDYKCALREHFKDNPGP